jgi:dethiobiotin synthetase
VSILVVSGTGTGVGKTVVSAAVCALARGRDSSVAYLKAAQTGVPGDVPDVDAVRALAGDVETLEGARYPDPLSPAAAARRAHRPPPDLDVVADLARRLAATHRLVVVEGAGGLLVRYDEDGTTLADLARQLDAPVLLVTGAGLGNLNTTALTLEAMAHRGLHLDGVVIGSWPDAPDVAARSNIRDLETLAARPLAGVIPDFGGRPAPDPAQFLETARTSLAPQYGGTFDAATFRTVWSS